MKTRIMLDLETLGTAPGSVILSIGAVKFDRKGVHGTDFLGFYRRIGPQSCIDAGLTMDVSTIMWWMKQSDAARQDLVKGDIFGLQDVLSSFSAWVSREGGVVEMWGNGASFDNSILGAAYDALKLKASWERDRANRCYRTVKALHPDLPMISRTGTHHNALDDARSQAEHLVTLPSFQRMCELEEGFADSP